MLTAVHLLTGKRHGTLHCGSTVDLVRRVWEHKNKVISGFAAKYGVENRDWLDLYRGLSL